MDLWEAIWQAAQIERETNEYDFLIDHGPTIQRGRAFENGPKGKRDDALSILIKNALVPRHRGFDGLDVGLQDG